MNNWRDVELINELYQYQIDISLHTGYQKALFDLLEAQIDPIYQYNKQRNKILDPEKLKEHIEENLRKYVITTNDDRELMRAYDANQFYSESVRLIGLIKT